MTLIEIIKNSEGLRLESYLCPSGLWTIGWGHTKGVKEGQTCTLAEAERYLKEDIQEAKAFVLSRVKVSLSPNQLDALTSFAFNIKKSQFNDKDCTLLRLVNLGEFNRAACQFSRWVYGSDPKTGKPIKLNGLVTRRAHEEALFSRK
jgi:lysozyme